MKKTIIYLSLAFLSVGTFSYGQNNVGIGTTSPDPSSILDLESTTQGVLVPRMTSAERTAIVGPAEALLIYDTDVDCFFYFVTATGWENLCSGVVGPAGPQGPAGANGAPGAVGPAGPAGAQGPAGANGAPGAVGPQGPAGTNGTNGTNGTTGAVGPQGPAGTNGTNGTNGAPGAVGPQGPAGVTFKQGVFLASTWTVNTAAWANVTPITFNFVAQNTSAQVLFSASGYGYTNSMAFVQFRILNNGVSIGGTNEKIQNYDDVTGTVTPWSCSFTRLLTGLTVGANYTLQVQGQRNGISGTYDAIVDPSLNGHHMSLSVIQ